MLAGEAMNACRIGSALSLRALVALGGLFIALAACAQAPPGGTSPIPEDSHLSTLVGGLEATGSSAKVIDVSGQPFEKALQVTVGRASVDTNATQLTILNSKPIRQGDVMLATLYVRGQNEQGGPARAEFLFEKATDPWTKSVTRGAVAARSPGQWRKTQVPFAAAADYAVGEAMVSIRLAFGPQTVEIGGLDVQNFGSSRSLDELMEFVTTENRLGSVRVDVDLKKTAQTFEGLGGNFCQPRYGETEAMDSVGQYALDNLRVVHARIGMPMNHWNPEPGVFRDEAQAKASFEAMQIMKRRGIPITVSVWEGPGWMLGGQPEQSGRTLAPEKYGDCIESIVQYLVTARDKYGVEADYFSFNEPDYGVNFRFTPEQMVAFMKQAMREFRSAGLKTKFLTADTANGTNFYDYARPLLREPELRPFLGPLAFHSWDALGASEDSYRRIAQLGRETGMPVWCMEAGHDAQLWQAPNPWPSWDNALRLAMAYERTVRLTESSLMAYWTYQDNYPLVDGDSGKPHPAFHVMRQMQDVFVPGWNMAAATPGQDDLQTLASVGEGKFAVLLVNPIGAGEVTLHGLIPGAAARVVTSTAARQAYGTREALRVSADGTLKVSVPARAVVTVLGG